jgi:hypothetical protein
MAFCQFLLGAVTFTVARAPLLVHCDVFKASPELADSPYRVKSPVPDTAFSLFIDAIEGRDITLTSELTPFLSQLCQEFGFSGLAARIVIFDSDAQLQARVSALEQRLAVIQEAAEGGEFLVRLSALERQLSAFPGPHIGSGGDLFQRVARLEERVAVNERRISAIEARLISQGSPDFSSVAYEMDPTIVANGWGAATAL